MPSHRTRPRSLVSRIRRLERELAALKDAPPVYVPYPVPAYYPMPVPSYPINPNPYPLTIGDPTTAAPLIFGPSYTITSNTTATQPITVTLDGSSGYTTIIDTTGTATTANPIIFNTHD